ncbi:MAG: hypothetical protein M1337_00745, partial [Actinobacteria bacterium]|nr:hypothetical protein [Actinomycetota bacterium]
MAESPHVHRDSGGIGRAHAPGAPLDVYQPATEEEMQRADIVLDNRLLRWMTTLTPRYLLLVFFLGLVVLAGFATWGIQMNKGIGIAGIRRPVGWGFYVTNFVFWIGISHSGTLISAILRVLKVDWRTPLTRAAELMTVFALMIGALFPLAQLPLAAALGHAGHLHLPHHERPLPVSAPHSRSGRAPRPHGGYPGARLQDALVGVAGLAAAVEPARAGHAHLHHHRHPGGGLGALHRVVGLRHDPAAGVE